MLDLNLLKREWEGALQAISLNFGGMLEEHEAIRKENELLRNALTLSPVSMRFAKWNDRVLKFNRQVRFHPSVDTDGGVVMFEVENPGLGIHCFGQSRNELIQELNEQIFVIYDEYVCKDPETMTESAKMVRETWRNIIEKECRDEVVVDGNRVDSDHEYCKVTLWKLFNMADQQGKEIEQLRNAIAAHREALQDKPQDWWDEKLWEALKG